MAKYTISSYPAFSLNNLAGPHTNLSAMCIAVGILVTVYVQKLLMLVRVHLGEQLILLVLSFGMAVMVLLSENPNWFTYSAAPRDLIAILMPIRIFVTVFSADLHILRHCIWQLILMNTLGVAVFVLCFGLAMSSATLRQVNWEYIFIFGVAVSSCDSYTLQKRLASCEMPSTINALILAESITVFSNALIMIDIYRGYTEGMVVSVCQIIFIHMRMVYVALFVGYSISKICKLMLTHLVKHEFLVLAWIIIAYVMYILCEGYFYVSGSFAVFPFAIMMSMEKNRITATTFKKIEFILESWHFLIMAFVYQMTCGNYAMFFYQYFHVNTIFLSICCCIFRKLARTAVVLCMYPFMFHRKHNNSNAIMTMILAREGVLEMNLVRILLYHPFTHSMIEYSYQILLLTVLLEAFLNNTAVHMVFKTFGTNVVSIARTTNIASCFDMLENTRMISLRMFQMDKYYSDVNWMVIHKATNLLAAQDWKSRDKKQEHVYGFRSSCFECQGQFSSMTEYEQIERLKELRSLILRTQRISFLRQRASGLIHKSDLKELFSALDVTALSNNLHIHIPEFSLLYKRSVVQDIKGILVNLQPYTRTELHRECLANGESCRVVHIVMHPAYQICMYLVVILNTIIFYINLFSECSKQWISCLPYLVFVVDFYLRVRYQRLLKKKTALRYFLQVWLRLDMIMLMINTIEVIISLLQLNCEKLSIYGYVVFLMLLFIGQLRLMKIIPLCLLLNKAAIRYCDFMIDERVATGYSRALSILYSYHEVLHILPTLVDNPDIKIAIEKEITKEKAILLAQLSNVQYKFTRVAVTCKTQRIVNTSISTMRETIVALKLTGFTDENENLELITRLAKLRKPALKLTNAECMSPDQILKWQPFFEGMTDFEVLFNSATIRHYKPDDYILTKGQLTGGIIIIIEGLASMELSMDSKIRSRVKHHGALPIKDYLCDVDYYHSHYHYMIPGNSLGILSFLTNRPCDFNVQAMVATKAFFLNADALNAAILINSDPVHGLRPRMWKYVGVNLALGIMWKVPMYRNLRVEETYYYMEKSFVPDMTGMHMIYISDDVEDLILIEGKILDKISGKLYVAPCYVPRSVRRIQLVRHRQMEIEPQLFVIPIKPELHTKIFKTFKDYKFRKRTETKTHAVGFNTTISKYLKLSEQANAKYPMDHKSMCEGEEE